MGEGHSNVSDHGSRGPTGGVKGGPTGFGGGNPNSGKGWGVSQTPYGPIRNYNPSKFGDGNRGFGGNQGGGSHSGSFGTNPPAALRPELQAYMAVGGIPAVITLIDGNWGITLSRLPAVATYIESHLARMGSWLMRTSPVGVAIMGMMPAKIASDPPMGHYFTTPILPANKVTDIPAETLKTIAEAPVNLQISDVTDEGRQQVILVKNIVERQRVPVIKAVPTAIPEVYTAAVPGMTPMHIQVTDQAILGLPATPAEKPTITAIEHAPTREITPPVGRHSRDAIIVFPDGTHIEPLYISLIQIASAAELMQEVRNTYEIACSEREAAERAMAQPFNSAVEELKLKKTLIDKYIIEVAAHIILLESNILLLKQEEATIWQQYESLAGFKNRLIFINLRQRLDLRALALVKQGEINTLSEGIAELRVKQQGLLELQQSVSTDIAIAIAAERQRVENARLVAIAAERQRVENARLAAVAAERQRVENARLAAVAAERQRVENARLAAVAAERQRINDEKLAAIWLRMEKARLAAKAADDLARQQGAFGQDTYSLPAHPLISRYSPSFAVAGVGAVILTPQVIHGLTGVLGAALAKLRTYATSWWNSPLAMMVGASFNPLGTGHDLGAVPLAGSIALSEMGLSPTTPLPPQGEIVLPVRMLMINTHNGTKFYAVKTGAAGISTKVKVGAAQFDRSKGVYTFTTDSQPPRTFTFTPVRPSGIDIGWIFPQPASAPATPLHTGVTIKYAATPVILPFPQLAERDFHDYIIWFPAESGLQPVYVYLNSPRGKSGEVTGRGQRVVGIWLAEAGKGLGVPIPTQIADKLRGRRFSSFDRFREAFWQEVANDPELAGQFNPENVTRMKHERAPRARFVDTVGKRRSFEIHHIKQISDGGDVYNVDNLHVITPKRHIEIHSNKGK
ncbi:S-type pyocin domain-containing protein [Yersinia kristensenii]|uniref:S-type pyocin domain-containing protein n=1 Tax=Yersinia kristensenii TaxID=28152 RepID=UPI0005E17FB8|nr:S-type pyocin domain-containing protein [Yersinia kristensenii]CNK76400.1 colicin/pyocin immunity family protein [Yersinia kristensenii]